VGIKDSTNDLICDVIGCCASSRDMGKICAYYEIVIENYKKRKDENERNWYM